MVGASAGGVEALVSLVRNLPADLPATVFIVLHLPAHAPSALPQILQRAGSLPAGSAVDGDPILPGRVHVAAPDTHLLVQRGHVRVVRGPRENGHRPAVDPLFRTAARAYGPRVIGVVLSGTLDDGTAGLLAIKQRGGIAAVQSPDSALFQGMPTSALENVAVDHCAPPAELAEIIVRLAHEPVDEEGAPPVSEQMEREAQIAELESGDLLADERPGTASGFTCPECHGGLWELRDGELIRFRCRVGHAYSGDSLLADQSQSLEAALWVALRVLRETAALARRLTERAQEQGHSRAAARFREQAEDADQRVELLRGVLLRGDGIAARGLRADTAQVGGDLVGS